MVNHQQIRQLSDRIVEQFQPKKIILFGSYAYGTPTADSDVDLLVILPPYEGRHSAKASDIRRAVHAGFPLDLLAYPSDYGSARIEAEDFFLREITSSGKVLYEATTI